MDDDDTLLEGLRAGDEAAFATLVDRYDGALRRLARTFVRTDAVADEVVQETWLGLVDGLDRFEGRSSLKTWLFSILINRARTRAVREARSVPLSSLAPEGREAAVSPEAFEATGVWREAPRPFETDPESRLLAGELRERLEAAVAELPEKQRAVITLRDMAGFTSPEVQELLDVSEVNQRVLLHRARAGVRARLAGYVEG